MERYFSVIPNDQCYFYEALKISYITRFGTSEHAIFDARIWCEHLLV